MRRTVIGYVYVYWITQILPDEDGILRINPCIYKTRKDLAKAMGNEWAKKAQKVKITIKKFIPKN